MNGNDLLNGLSHVEDRYVEEAEREKPGRKLPVGWLSMAAWDHIPPQKPNYFFAWLAKVCRNFAMGILDRRHAAKRSAEMVTLTAEMELCIPDSRREAELEGEEIGRILNEFLAGLSRESRILFLRRYWYAESIAEIAGRYGMGESKVKTSLHRSRNKLRQHLEKEGIRL